MRALPLAILAAAAAAACAGHTPAPETAGTAPSAARTPAAPADPTTVRLGTGTSRYRYEQTQHAAREAMGQNLETDASTTMMLTVAVTPGENGNFNAAFTIDSVAITGAADNTGPLDQLRGKTFRTTVSPQGRTLTFVPPDSTALSSLGGEMFKDFLPSVPAGNVAAGTTWVDTVTPPPTTVQGATIQTRSIRTHRVVGWETRDGARVLHLTTNGAYSIEGSGEQGGAQFTIAGTGTATTERYLSGTGIFLSAAGSDSSNILVDVPAAGIQIPIRQTRRSTLTRLP